MAKVKIKMNHATAQAYLDGRYGVADLLTGLAERSLTTARSTAPSWPGYALSLHTFTAHTDRMVARVGSSDAKAFVVESKYGTLARCLDGARG